MKWAGGSLAESLGPYAPLAGTAFGTFTTKKDISPLPIPRLPAGRAEAGYTLSISAAGEYTCATGVTLALGFYLGTLDDASGSVPAIVTDIALSSVITTGTSPTAWPWRMTWEGKIIKTGASGSMIGGGTLDLGTSLIAYSSTPVPITAALRTVAINTTVDNRIGVSGTYGASASGNNVTTYYVNATISAGG